MALTPEEDKLYTTNGVSGDVTVVDVASLKAEKTMSAMMRDFLTVTGKSRH